jgi:hypothetical protein|tara:strand:+ start:358 stop:570 length:213 start_codon:yes stop_codon:yes gene_type:complete
MSHCVHISRQTRDICPEDTNKAYRDICQQVYQEEIKRNALQSDAISKIQRKVDTSNLSWRFQQRLKRNIV